MNPLVGIVPILAGLWITLVLLDWASGSRWVGRVESVIRHKPWPAALVGLAIVNWIYVIAFLPR